MARGVGRRQLVSLVLAGAFIGCAARTAEEAPPAAPESQAAPRLGDLDALEHDLGVAEQRLEVELRRKQSAVAMDRHNRAEDEADEGGEDEKPKDALERAGGKPTEQPSREPTQPSRAAPEWDKAELATPCDKACRALASMKRSAERICELAGSTDARCTSAQSRVARAKERVERSGCACRVR